MDTKKVLTKGGNYAVIVNNDFSIVKKEDQFFFYPNVTNGTICEDQDASEFLEALEIHNAKLRANEAAKKEEAREKERQRIADLEKEITECKTPKELAEKFNLPVVELASHWSDLYEGRSTFGILISDAKENEILELAKEIHNIDGVFGEAKRRDGEHHSTFSETCDLKSYQKGCKEHFSGDHYFYKSPEDEADFYISDLIKDIIDDEDLTAFEKMEAIKGTVKSWEDIEPGYYDCNGNLEISDNDLNSPDFTGYYQDVYSYSFCFKFWQGNRWQEEVEEEEETETPAN